MKCLKHVFFFVKGPFSRSYRRTPFLRLIVQPCDEDDNDQFLFLFPSNVVLHYMEWNWQGKTEVLGEKPVPVPLCPQQIPHRLTWDFFSFDPFCTFKSFRPSSCHLCSILVLIRHNTNIHAPGGIRTHNPSKRAAVDHALDRAAMRSNPGLHGGRPATRRLSHGTDSIVLLHNHFVFVKRRGPPSLLYNGYRVIPGGKAVGAWCWPPTPSSTEVKERVELPILPFWAFMACHRATFTFYCTSLVTCRAHHVIEMTGS
jgi:hypothetical protein